ncbi:MAG: hypothetical protein WCS37_21410 [Chloroflexota bacterium]
MSVSATLKWEGVESRLSAVADILNQRANEGELFPRSMGIQPYPCQSASAINASPTTAKNLDLSLKEQG